MSDKKMISKIQALGKEISLPTGVDDTMVLDRARILSILRDYDPEVARELESVEFTIRVEENVAIIYRDSAVMG